MNNNDFTLDIIAGLNKQLSKAKLKNDLKGIDNTLSVKVIAKLATALSKKQLGESLKQLNNLYVQVGTKLKTDKDTRNKLLNEIGQLQKNLTELQLRVNYRFAGNYLPILYKNCRLSSLHPKKKEQIKRRDFCTLLAPFLDV